MHYGEQDYTKIDINKLMEGQGSSDHNAIYKVVCFGPVLRHIGESEKENNENGYVIYTDINVYYHFTFAGRKRIKIHRL
jgi:hypothetical protein